MYYYMSHLLLTSSLEPLHGFAPNFVWMFLRWTPTKFVKIGVYPYFSWNNGIILCNFWPILKKYKTTDQKSFIFGLEIGLVSSLFKLGCSDLYLRF